MMISYEEKCARLCELIASCTGEDVMLAFSGGADSCLLLKLLCDSARKSGKKVYAVTLHTMLHTAVEMEEAKRLAGQEGAVFLPLFVDELQNAGILQNPVDRCYLCKKYLFTQILKKAEQLQVRTVAEGSNEDDLHGYRPGLKAVRELGIVSPLALAGMTKQEVRRYGAELGISASEKPSTPCLATRFPYGTALTRENMRRVELGEGMLKRLGFYNVRLRVHGDVARIEVDERDMAVLLEKKTEVTAFLKDLGYTYVTLDLEGFRSGSMDAHIV